MGYASLPAFKLAGVSAITEHGVGYQVVHAEMNQHRVEGKVQQYARETLDVVSPA